MRVLIALIALLLVVPAVAEAKPRRCKRGGVQVLAQSSAAVLSYRNGTLFGCLHRDGKMHVLESGIGFPDSTVNLPRAAGAYVAYQRLFCSKEQCESGGFVTVVDLRKPRDPTGTFLVDR